MANSLRNPKDLTVVLWRTRVAIICFGCIYANIWKGPHLLVIITCHIGKIYSRATCESCSIRNLIVSPQSRPHQSVVPCLHNYYQWLPRRQTKQQQQEPMAFSSGGRANAVRIQRTVERLVVGLNDCQQLQASASFFSSSSSLTLFSVTSPHFMPIIVIISNRNSICKHNFSVITVIKIIYTEPELAGIDSAAMVIYTMKSAGTINYDYAKRE